MTFKSWCLKFKSKRGKKEGPKPNPPDQPAPPIPAPSSTTASAAPSPSPPPAPAASPQLVSPDTAPTIQSLPERLWNRAYDDLKEEESGLVDAYEKLLSRELEGDPSSTDLTSQKNEIEQKHPEMRRDQMSRLVTDGLEKIERETKIKGNIEEGMQPLSSAKGVIDTVVKAYPEASLAWAGVCCALQMLANPITETRANREGIAYVVSRMEWYWQLSRLLLDDGKSAGLRDELEKHVIDLYKTLLSYQMKSVYLYYRSRHVVFWRDVIKLDDWDGSLKTIKSAEDAIRQDAFTYNIESIKGHFEKLVEAAKFQQKLLPDIHQSIQDQTAAQWEMRQQEKNEKCLADLRVTDPRGDKKRIEDMKGGLHRDLSNWILEHEDFQRWRNNDEARLLWIKGDPGKGKTMLLIAIVDELEKQLAHQGPSAALSYFFCQGTDENLNNAAAVLRGLIYLLGDKYPSLILHLRKRYDTAGPKLFEGANAFVALSEILESMLRNLSLSRVYIVIDALDECVADLEKLLKFIIRNTSESPRVKWIVSSRNHVEQRLDKSGVTVSLELTQNAKQVADAVNAYIDFKISKVKSLQDDNGLRAQVQAIMRQKATGTFLWVALVVHELENVKSWHVLKVVEELPAGLEELYARMIKYIQQLERDSEFCRRILSTVTLAYQPLRLAELGVLSGLPNEITGSTNNIRDIVAMCGSFLTIQGGYVYLIHQSAKDYLSGEASSTVFPSGLTDVHHTIFSRSLQAMSTTLHRNIYNLRHPGLLIGEIKAPDPDPLAAIRYSCVHWISHFCDAYSSSRPEVETIGQFLREKFLYWLEALGLIQHMGDVILSMTRLESLLRVSLHSAILTNKTDQYRNSHAMANY
ncbi:NACHT domain-containing protein [Xylaria arbuscula]|nr:NACHT domain-containing protein [Xylaria arbuscula]